MCIRDSHGTYENLRFVRGDILKPEAGYKEYKPGSGKAPLEFPGEGFDLIFMAGTLEQYKKEEAEEVLKAAAGLLKPEGMHFALLARNLIHPLLSCYKLEWTKVVKKMRLIS